MLRLCLLGCFRNRQGFPDPLTSLGNFIQGSTSQKATCKEKKTGNWPWCRAVWQNISYKSHIQKGKTFWLTLEIVGFSFPSILSDKFRRKKKPILNLEDVLCSFSLLFLDLLFKLETWTCGRTRLLRYTGAPKCVKTTRKG